MDERADIKDHVMISYQWDSQKQMIKLRDKLKQEGYRVWMDIDKIEGDILESMGKAVEKAAVVLVCISSKYQNSKSCRTEAEYAFQKNKTIIPIKVEPEFEPSSWLGPIIGTRLYYSMDTDELLRKNLPGLIRALGDKGRHGRRGELMRSANVDDTIACAEATVVSASRPRNTFSRRTRRALECSICLERFRQPKTLPCLHSFCKECLLGCAPLGTKTFPCPQCREEANVPGGDATKFKSNFHLQELVEEEALREQLTGASDNKFTCTCCDATEQSQAVGKCQDCNHYLCGSGVDAHRRFPALRKHSVLTFEEDYDHDDTKSSQASPSSPTQQKEKQAEPAPSTSWEIFDALFNEDHSGHLLKYWIQRHGGGKGWQGAMVHHYTVCLSELEEDGVISDNALAKRWGQVARVFMQAGQYDEAIALVEKILELEQNELGSRTENMADLYSLASKIHLEKSKQEDFVIPSALSVEREVIRNARKAIKLYKKCEQNGETKYKLGKTLVTLTFSLSNWIQKEGDAVLTVEEASEESKRHIENAIQLFTELNSRGNLADAIMTKALLSERGSAEKEELNMEALKLCVEVYGECSVLTSRINFNIGIMYEDRYDTYAAYKWFVKTKEIREKVFGQHHVKTEQCRRCLEEPKYVKIKNELKAKVREQFFTR